VIYEASPTLTELGAGVGMYLRTWRIMQNYGEAMTANIKRISSSLKHFSEDDCECDHNLDFIGCAHQILDNTFLFRKGDSLLEGLSFYTLKAPCKCIP